ncbi:uncharacterized protein LOC142844365 [Microtus pennsylvanicus]|uniref:uncharacterized protein LOC142844365 n=1 Tax=Microtus pennsylvanicus TaxID=10058 RepID=UPI003F6D943C
MTTKGVPHSCSGVSCLGRDVSRTPSVATERRARHLLGRLSYVPGWRRSPGPKGRPGPVRWRLLRPPAPGSPPSQHRSSGSAGRRRAASRRRRPDAGASARPGSPGSRPRAAAGPCGSRPCRAAPPAAERPREGAPTRRAPRAKPAWPCGCRAIGIENSAVPGAGRLLLRGNPAMPKPQGCLHTNFHTPARPAYYRWPGTVKEGRFHDTFTTPSSSISQRPPAAAAMLDLNPGPPRQGQYQWKGTEFLSNGNQRFCSLSTILLQSSLKAYNHLKVVLKA